VPAEFTLYGETAIALHLGHRPSIDFDFFGSRTFDPTERQSAIAFLADARIRQREGNTLTAILERGGQVAVSFFGVPKLPRLASPVVSDDNGLKIASLLDLAGTKAATIQLRAEAKDYLDLDCIITKGGLVLRRHWRLRRSCMGRASILMSPSRHCHISKTEIFRLCRKMRKCD